VSFLALAPWTTVDRHPDPSAGMIRGISHQSQRYRLIFPVFISYKVKPKRVSRR